MANAPSSTRMPGQPSSRTHNAQPYRDGVLFNDSQDDVLRYTGRGEGEEEHEAGRDAEVGEAGKEAEELVGRVAARAGEE